LAAGITTVTIVRAFRRPRPSILPGG
jgi:hypothetical protein